MHEERRRAATTTTLERIDWHRTKLMLEIDRWAALHPPVPHGGARLHAETIGGIVDRLAQLSVQAYLRLADPSDDEFGHATAVLTDLADAYQDLKTRSSA